MDDRGKTVGGGVEFCPLYFLSASFLHEDKQRRQACCGEQPGQEDTNSAKETKEAQRRQVGNNEGADSGCHGKGDEERGEKPALHHCPEGLPQLLFTAVFIRATEEEINGSCECYGEK